MTSNSTATRCAFVLVAVSAGALVTAPAPAADRDAGMARMAGVWQIDRQVSEDPLRMLRDATRGWVPREGQPDPTAQFEERAKWVIDGSQVLTLVYRDQVLTITDWDDRVQTLPVDGKKHAAERNGLPVEVEAGWKSSDRLVVKTTGLPGGWVRESYELGERGDKLFVTIELQRRRSKYPFAFERLYHRAGPGS